MPWANESGKLFFEPPHRCPADGFPGEQHIEGVHICMIDIHLSLNPGRSQVPDIILCFLKKRLPVTDKCIGRRKVSEIRLVCRSCIG